MKIEGHLAIISGAASGLGEATARHLAKRGARIGVLDFDADRGAKVAADLGGVSAQCDVGDPDAVERAMGEVLDAAGQPPRMVVNCAGIAPAARVVGREGKLALDTFERTIRVNLLGTYYVMSFAGRAMTQADALEDGARGVIVNTSSIAYLEAQLGQTAYGASKGGVASMTLPAARDFAQHGIRVMAIAPGLFNTPMMQGLPDEVTEKIVANIQNPSRLGDPDEFALMVAQIIENPYLNGEVIRLDGATRLPPR